MHRLQLETESVNVLGSVAFTYFDNELGDWDHIFFGTAGQLHLVLD